MKAEEVSVENFLEVPNTQFVIPVYQRNYDWGNAQCYTLLNDIIKAGEDNAIKSHFIGSIVHLKDDEVSTTSSIKELMLIDGQQRLTTLTLIYLALYKYFEICNNDDKDEILEHYLINKFDKNSKDEHKLKLVQSKQNLEILANIFTCQDLSKIEKELGIINNFFIFFNYLNSDKDNHKTLRKGLKKLILVEISLDKKKDDPQRIFESLNSTGLDLNEADLIRNYILIGLNKSEQNYIFKNYWHIIEQNTIDKELGHNKVPDFIRDFLTLKFKHTSNKNKIYQTFKEKYPNKDYDSIKTLLGEVTRYSYHYKKLLNPQTEKDKEIQQQLDYINQLEIGVSYPFLMQVFDDYEQNKINKNQLIQVLELIQSYIWRRFIVGAATNSLNKIFPTLYSDIDLQDYVNSLHLALSKKQGTSRFPSDDEIFVALGIKDVYNIKSKNRMYFLSRLEHFKNNEPININQANITIEHIFPQNPHKDWEGDISEKDREFLQKHLHTIGNLTLSGNNSGLGNKTFLQKRDYENNGYANSGIWLNRQLAKFDKWSVEEFEQRFETIATRFAQIWIAPIDAPNLDEDYINIFDAEDPTGKKLVGAKFIDEYLKVKEISDLYKEILLRLIDKDILLILNNEIGSKIGLALSEDGLRKPFKLTEKWYIETHFNSIAKVRYIKRLLELFELEDELLIKYK